MASRTDTIAELRAAISGAISAVRERDGLFLHEVMIALSEELVAVSMQQQCLDMGGCSGEGCPPLKGGTPPDPGTDSKRARAADTGWGRWTPDQFRKKAEEANDKPEPILAPDELADFCEYWLSPTKSGRPAFTQAKTWNMRARLRTAFDMVYARRRDPSLGSAQHRQWQQPVGGGSDVDRSLM